MTNTRLAARTNDVRHPRSARWISESPELGQESFRHVIRDAIGAERQQLVTARRQCPSKVAGELALVGRKQRAIGSIDEEPSARVDDLLSGRTRCGRAVGRLANLRGRV